jgi:hypothetical protein
VAAGCKDAWLESDAVRSGGAEGVKIAGCPSPAVLAVLPTIAAAAGGSGGVVTTRLTSAAYEAWDGGGPAGQVGIMTPMPLPSGPQ